ncbi:MAG: hypothetical protein QXU87_08675 [Candidatus Caldarchaeum sp.]|uniref:Uncharacterized protein n=1 Tax=Caldiarchaeum subterraneum TaxID=311458 RepID=A0A7C5Q6N0_CALS0
MNEFSSSDSRLSKAAAEAIANWLQQTHASMEIEFVGDPVDADAVELQHRAAEMWKLKVLRDASTPTYFLKYCWAGREAKNVNSCLGL